MPLLRPAGTLHLQLPVKSQRSPVKREVLVINASTQTQMRPLAYVRFILPQGSQALATLIDSGADANIMDKELARQLGIDPVPLPHPIPAHALDGHSLGADTHQTVPIHVLMLGR